MELRDFNYTKGVRLYHILTPLLKPVPRHEFESLAGKHHIGQKLRSASRWDQFVGMLMSQLSGRQSLRDIQPNLEAQQYKFYHLDCKTHLG
jgi:putative transposase